MVCLGAGVKIQPAASVLKNVLFERAKQCAYTLHCQLHTSTDQKKRTTGSRSSVCTKPYRKPVLHILTKARDFFRGRATHQVVTGLDDGAQDEAGVTVKVIYNSVNNHYLPGLTEYDHSPFLVSYRVQYLKGYLYHSNILIQV